VTDPESAANDHRRVIRLEDSAKPAAHQYTKQRSAQGHQVPALPVAGGLTFEDQSFKELAPWVPRVSSSLARPRSLLPTADC